MVCFLLEVLGVIILPVKTWIKLGCRFINYKTPRYLYGFNIQCDNVYNKHICTLEFMIKISFTYKFATLINQFAEQLSNNI